MKNTLENKAKFFAQYYGQIILKYPSDNRLYNCSPIQVNNGQFLELKPLSKITDEDANYKGHFNRRTMLTHWSIEQCDYLRSKGYALPWSGLTVEQQIEYGWIKLV